MSKSDRDWHQIADEATAEVEGAPQGAKEALIATIAERQGIGAQTLRTYLLASRFMRTLSSQLKTDATKMPAIAVETVARWNRYDPVAAAQAINEYAAGKYSIRSLARAETAARRARGVLSGTQQRRNDKAIISREFERLVTLWPSQPKFLLNGGELVEAEDPNSEADFMVQELHYDTRMRPTRGRKLIAVLVVGPYSVRQAYDSKAADWCLRALGLTFFHERLALVLPKGSPSDAYVAFLSRVPKADSCLHLVGYPDGTDVHQSNDYR